MVLWALWAGKETAYKIAKKFDSAASGIPRFYEATITIEGTLDAEETAPDGAAIFGRVDTPCGQVLCRYSITRDYVHCIGSANVAWILDSVIWQVDRIGPASGDAPDFESVAVRKALKKHLSAYGNRSPEDIEIRREKGPQGLGPPLVYINGRQADIDISLSHDGRFAAYAFAERSDFTASPNRDVWFNLSVDVISI